MKKLKQITLPDLLEMFDESVHAKLNEQAHKPGVVAFVVFENMMMDSSAFGARTAVVVGPGCTFKSVSDTVDKWLNDLPSQRQHASAFCPLSNDPAGNLPDDSQKPECGGVVL